MRSGHRGERMYRVLLRAARRLAGLLPRLHPPVPWDLRVSTSCTGNDDCTAPAICLEGRCVVPDAGDAEADGSPEADVESGTDGEADDGDGHDVDTPCGPDSDGDTVVDAQEGTGDTDGDTLPAASDDDSDGDGLPDAVEAGDADPCTSPADFDADATPDFLDADSDDDTIGDADEGLGDVDGDGIPNRHDPDSDGDTFPDADEAGDADESTPPVDSDGDGLADFLDADSAPRHHRLPAPAPSAATEPASRIAPNRPRRLRDRRTVRWSTGACAATDTACALFGTAECPDPAGPSAWCGPGDAPSQGARVAALRRVACPPAQRAAVAIAPARDPRRAARLRR